MSAPTTRLRFLEGEATGSGVLMLLGSLGCSGLATLPKGLLVQPPRLCRACCSQSCSRGQWWL